MTSTIEASHAPPARRVRLWLEFVALFVGAPLAMTAWFGAYALFATLYVLTAASLALLALTPGFRLRHLLRLPDRGDMLAIAAFTAISAVLCAALTLWLRPASFLWMPTRNPALWTMILMWYPPLSALPQEIIFRSLFFERYGGLFPSRAAGALASGGAFGLGHLFFMNPVAIGTTTVAGVFMGWVYMRNRSLITATILHAIGGLMVFTMGLGTYFYHGAIGRAW
ncbi:MAG: type II CAAX prenyl endopeptidase Rce1 family protein [Rubrimonas sp.]